MFNIVCQIYNIISYLLNINLEAPITSFFQKTAFESGLLFLKDIAFFFEIVICHCFRPKPHTRMCVLTIGSFSQFGKIMKNQGKTLVESWFFLFSLIWDFSV